MSPLGEIATMLPPPAPTVLMSTCCDLTGKMPSLPAPVIVKLPSRMRQTSVDVPPMSQVRMLGCPAMRPMNCAAMTPAA